jgi:hypothetical protein
MSQVESLLSSDLLRTGESLPDIDIEALQELYRESIKVRWPTLATDKVEWIVQHCFDKERLGQSRDARVQERVKLERRVAFEIELSNFLSVREKARGQVSIQNTE